MDNSKIVIDHNASTLSLEDFLSSPAHDESDMELLHFFQEEVTETLSKMDKTIAEWHQRESECPLVELRREFHTLKGAANSIGQLRIGALTDGMKATLDLLDRESADLLLQDVTKASILTMEAVRGLLTEAMNPQYTQAPRSRSVQAVNSIQSLQKKIRSLGGVHE